jgi:hypothetical protein
MRCKTCGENTITLVGTCSRSRCLSNSKLDYGFTSKLNTDFLEESIDGKWFVLGEPLYYIAKDGELFRVPAGVCTDFASIPRGLRWLIPRIGKHGKAAVLHDWLCEFKIIPRDQADMIFLEAMVSLGVNRVKRRVMYTAVAGYTKLLRRKG